ncbi:exocyst complex component EXO70A1-like [Oryza brachyantha]|uniref:Exocyst subunit Exo70 family protein n=1 Tax=Oryza brachyantha TaxID=4533 RepID=J3N672_ORYBR|nr:exocyst complex component EXO70A1-like [Oryza brachyantha]
MAVATAALPRTVEALERRATMLRDSLQRSQGNTEGMVTILGSFDHRLSGLEAAMRPTQVRTHAIRMAHENIDKTIKAADGILSQFDLARRAEAAVLKGPHEDLESYLEAVDLLKGIVRFFSSNKNFKSSEGVLNHVNNLLAKSALKIEEEFRQLMTTYSKPIEPDRLFDCLPKSLRPTKDDPDGDRGNAGHSEHPSKSLETAVYRTPTLIPPRILPLMNDIAQQLVQAGNQQSCHKVYRESRGSALELSLQKLGVEKLSKEDVQKMQWEALEAKIGNWIHFMRIGVKLLLAGERKICDQIFDGVNFNKDQCFAELTANSVVTLLSFGDAVAKSKRSPEKLFVLLDMYEVMRELQSEMEVIFEGQSCSEMRKASLSLTKRLAQTAQETFADFEDAVEKDASKTIVNDGTVHPLTSYVINYVKFLFDYQSTLKLLFQEFETGSETESQLTIVTMRIMQALQNNLDGKSKQYRDPALTNLFLMNNIHYMVRSVRRSEAKDILGDDWIQRHRRIVQQNANQYKRVAWAKILQTLSIQGAGSTGSSTASDLSSSGVSRAMIKERFKSFNMQFEELHAKQSQWIVPDQELRESLRLAVAEVLLPAYRSFVKRFGNLVENGKNPHKYVRYSAEMVEQLLGEFFEGQQWGDQKR